MYVSGPILASEGGQIHGVLKQYSSLIDTEYRVIRGEEDAINAVRENITYGADLIKICVNNSPNNTSLTIPEMKAIVRTATRYGKKVTAHATSNIAVWEAIQAGVHGIEHGYYLEDSTLALMAANDIPLVPTDMSETLWKKLLEFMDMEYSDAYLNFQRGRLMRAYNAGVMIVAGSDNYMNFVMPQGQAAKHVLLSYFEAGMNPRDILQSATYNSAIFMNLTDQLGVIREGAFADIVAFNGDIESDFARTVFDVVFVMKGGEVVNSVNDD